MPNDSAQLIRQNSKGLTLDELFITQQESICFTDQISSKKFQYSNIATRIKKYGYGGILTLNNQHMSLIFNDQKPCDLYIHKDTNQVSNLLLTYFFFSQHSDNKEQALEFWQLLNPNFEDKIVAKTLIEAIRFLSKLAVDIALILVSRSVAKDQYSQHMMNESLKYLRRALQTKDQFLEELADVVPQQLSFTNFTNLVECLCFTPSQLRMAITRTEPSSLGFKVVTSGPATVIISFMTTDEKQQNQLVCRKWYNSFVPLLLKIALINKIPSEQTLFRLFTEYEGQRYYLGALRKEINDMREEDKDGEKGRTTFVSAGCTQEYAQFKWRLDGEGRLCLNDSPQLASMPKQEAYLGAHRTYNIDIWGNGYTYVLVTTFKAHEGFWAIQRVGDPKDNRCIVFITNNRCVNDKVNHIGWQVDLPTREESPQDVQKDRDWFETKKRPFRTPNSVYVMLRKSSQQQQLGIKTVRTWTLEVIKQNHDKI